MHYFLRLNYLLKKKITDGNTLLFLDEIQECPPALTALRYFYEKRPHLHVVAAGSLLEFALDGFSFPVGRIKTLYVYPMNFFEYLKAADKEQLATIVDSKPKALTQAEHELLLKEYITFLYLGGMPEVISRYIATKSLLSAMEVQQDLALLLESDFGKYVGRAAIDCLRQVYRASAFQLTNIIKYSHLTSDFSVPTIQNAVKLLIRAQIINKIPHVNPQGLPLGGSASLKRFKIILADIGLLHGLSRFSVKERINSESILDVYRGALAEQAVGQGLYEQTEGQLYTWNRKEQGSQAEVDYVIAKDTNIYPIEVKSGSPGRMKSLYSFLKRYQLAKMGIVISTAPYKELPNERLIMLPIYYSGSFLKWF
jgi:uncharacterized protein